MPYRTDLPALEEQRARIWRDLEALRRARMAAEAAASREKELAAELAALEYRLRAARTKSPLDDIRIASPCKASWDDMVGDERVRFCGQCAKNVYDLSVMTRDEAETFLAAHEGAELPCIRLARRSDGTVVTRDCPVGERKKRVRLAVVTAAGGAAMRLFASMISGPTLGGMARRPMPPIPELVPPPPIPIGDPPAAPPPPAHEMGEPRAAVPK